MEDVVVGVDTVRLLVPEADIRHWPGEAMDYVARGRAVDARVTEDTTASVVMVDRPEVGRSRAWVQWIPERDLVVELSAGKCFGSDWRPLRYAQARDRLSDWLWSRYGIDVDAHYGRYDGASWDAADWARRGRPESRPEVSESAPSMPRPRWTRLDITGDRQVGDVGQYLAHLREAGQRLIPGRNKYHTYCDRSQGETVLWRTNSRSIMVYDKGHESGDPTAAGYARLEVRLRTRAAGTAFLEGVRSQFLWSMDERLPATWWHKFAGLIPGPEAFATPLYQRLLATCKTARMAMSLFGWVEAGRPPVAPDRTLRHWDRQVRCALVGLQGADKTCRKEGIEGGDSP